MKYLNRVKGVRYLGEYRLKLVFRDGFVGEIDLQPLVNNARGPWEEPLKEPGFFRQVTTDSRTITWPNGYDVCPDVLRYWCEIGRVCSQEELDQAFADASAPASACVLNDKPKS
jgi:hypothetical protein